METKTNMLKTADAAKYLGFKVSYLHKLMMNKVIPYYKPHGKLCYFDIKDLDEFLHGGRISSQSETDNIATEYLRTHTNKCR